MVRDTLTQVVEYVRSVGRCGGKARHRLNRRHWTDQESQSEVLVEAWLDTVATNVDNVVCLKK